MSKMGLVLDVDDTLADTARQCFRVIAEEVGLPEGMELDEAVATYHQPGAVPEWQVSGVQERIRQLLTDPDWLRQLPPVPGAVEAMGKLPHQLPVALYLTSRLDMFNQVTADWLVGQGFPPAAVQTRHRDVTQPDWKLHFLAAEYPLSYGLLDNELGFLPVSAAKYQGHLLWFNRYQASTTHPELVQFFSWSEIAQNLLQSG